MPDLTLTLATLKGRTEALREAKSAYDSAGMVLAGLQSVNATDTAATIALLQGLDTVGYYSTLDQGMRAHRFEGKSASIDFVKLNPTCTQAAAETAWVNAVLAWQTATPSAFVYTAAEVAFFAGFYGRWYRVNLLAMKAVADLTWEAQRAWIVATPKLTIMGA